MRTRCERTDLALLQHAQQLDLERRRGLADLIEEDGAAVRHLEQADAVLIGGALLASEQFAFEQFIRQRAAILDHERLVGAGRAIVNGAGEQLLAGAGPPVISTEIS